MATYRNYACVVPTTGETCVIGQGSQKVVSVTVHEKTDLIGVTAQLQGSTGLSDAFTVPAGKSLTLSEAGHLLDVQVVKLTSSSGTVTVDLLVCYP